MSTNYTEHLGLTLWEANDPVLRTEFNANHTKLDAAILAAQKSPCCVTGSYAGGTGSSKTTVNLGFRPSFLVIIRGKETSDSSATVAVIGNSSCKLGISYSSSAPLDTSVSITNTGFTVTANSNDRYGMNYSGTTYYYTAFY